MIEKIKVQLNRLKNYFKEVWREVDPKNGKVSWPKQPEVVSSTIIVMISVFIIGISIGLIDNVLTKVLNIVFR